MDKNKLLIHIGAGKAGSTAIQTFFSSSDKEKTGVNYLPLGRQHQGHHGIASALLGENRFDWLIPYEHDRLLSEIQELSSDNGPFFCSSEAFLTKEFVVRNGPYLLREAFKNYEVSLIAYLRNQVDSFESSYLQSLKTGAYRGTPENRLKFFNKQELGLFSEKLESFATHFGRENLTVVNYDANRDNILSPIKENLGLTADLSSNIKANVSGSFHSAHLLSQISQHTRLRLIGPDFKRLRDFIEEHVFDDDQYTIITESIRSELNEFHREENKILQDQYGIDLSQERKDRTNRKLYENNLELNFTQLSSFVTNLFQTSQIRPKSN